MKPIRSPWLATVALFLAFAAASLSAQQPEFTPPILPDAKLTPGDTLDVTLADIRETGYSSRVRNVPVAVKREVYASYGIQSWGKGQYEVDHLIPLCIGGSNSKRNLWPQSCLTQPWNAKVKNRLEYRLLSLVRSGKVDLATAQQDIARNWIDAYKKYVGPEPKPRGGGQPTASTILAAEPEEGTGKAAHDESVRKDEDPDTETESAPTAALTVAAATPAASPDAAPTADEHAGMVWVNTKSHVIWKPGGAWYGKTEHGKYMTAAEAEQAGYHYAHGTGH